MALDKLVDSAQLDSDLGDVADAIRAKSGGSSPLAFPAGFVSEIGSISGGGELLVDNVATEDVATINLVIPEGKKSYRVYVVELVGETSVTEWVYPHLNTTTPSTAGGYLSQKQTYNSKIVVSAIAYGGGGYVIPIFVGGSGSVIGTNLSALNNILLNLYYTTSVFRAGFEAKVWGYDI